MKTTLDLSNVCIETASKKAYNKAIFRYFKAKGKETEELEILIDLLVYFLEKSDFQELRNRYPELRGGSDASIELRMLPTGDIHLFCNNALIESATLTK